MENKEKFYITTPIYYPSGKWHLGTCYTTVVCDALARFNRMSGKDVFYLTGTDEHGQKIQKVAGAVDVPVREYIDKVVGDLQDLWGLLDISYDKFIRTTDEYHEKAVQKIFQKLYDNGDIYKGQYEGWYCTPCESYWTKSQLVDGKCPDCGREVQLMKEECYFFKLSKYQDRIIDLLENTDFLQPQTRVHEMVNNFLKPGLQDLAVTRTSFDWGVKVPFDDKHVIYVWIDALVNYITALGYTTEDDGAFARYWPADVQMMGKEIIRFHSIIWPAILMALDLPLPKKIYGHGWLMLGNDKISKSKGNIIDPVELCDRYGVDAVRYYLLREIPFGNDGSYTNRALLTRINNDLANDLGNLVSRTLAMVNQYFDGVIPQPVTKEDIDNDIIDLCNNVLGKAKKQMDNLNVPEALVEIFKLIQRANKYVDETAPWVLNKTGNKDRLATVMYNLCEVLRVSAIMLQPYLTKAPSKILDAMSVSVDCRNFEYAKFGKSVPNAKVNSIKPLFPRINIEKELVEMAKRAEEMKKETEKAKKEKAENIAKLSEISIDDFAKCKFLVGTVKTAEKVKKTAKLIKMTINDGKKDRTIVSGIAKYYTPEEMLGKQVVIVANLKPAKLCGIVSEGMILCASDDKGNLCIVSPEKTMASGAEVR